MVPVDSVSALPRATGAQPTTDPDESAGPFDLTEPGSAPAGPPEPTPDPEGPTV